MNVNINKFKIISGIIIAGGISLGYYYNKILIGLFLGLLIGIVFGILFGSENDRS